MKKIIISLTFLAIVFGVEAQKNLVKTNPLTLAFGSFNATYERVLNPSSSVLFKGHYMFEFMGEDVSLGGLGIGYRYYVTHVKKAVPGGFYAQPQLTMLLGSTQGYYEYGYGYERDKMSSFAIGAELGYQWCWSSGFTLDLGLGPSYRWMTTDGETVSGIIPSATVSIGFAF